MDLLKDLAEIGIGSRLKRLSEYMMRETQLVYNYFNIDFDPYLFPAFRIISDGNGVTNTEITESLQLSQPAVTQMINKLVERELILLHKDKSDKRKKIVVLSQKGEVLITKMTPIWNSIEQTIKEYTTITSNSLVESVTKLEERFNTKSFSKAIIERYKSNTNQ